MNFIGINILRTFDYTRPVHFYNIMLKNNDHILR
jgi:hypothetical protein